MPLSDFYTFLPEGDLLAEFPTIFKCAHIKSLRYETGDDLLLAQIKPSLTRRDGSISDKLIFLSRDSKESILSIKKWPIKVYVLIPLIENVDTKDEIMGNECVSIGWAELYYTEESATHSAFKGSDMY